MQWFKRLLGGETVKVPITSSPTVDASAGPVAPAHLALLGKFLHGADPAHVAHERWTAVLGEAPMPVLNRFRQAGWLIDSDTETRLDMTHRVNDLKLLLKARGLPVSGPKATQVQRLLAADPDGMRERVRDLEHWICASAVQPAVEAYRQGQADAEHSMKQRVLAALSRGAVEEAVSAVLAHERRQLFPRGMGIDWNSPQLPAQLAQEVNEILAAHCALLEGVPASELPAFRLAAAMLQLTGESDARPYLPSTLQGHPRLDSEVVARMLLFAGGHTHHMRQFREAGVRTVELSATGDSCPNCQRLGGRRFALGKAPPLPHKDCTHEMGCRCIYVADFG